MNELVSNGVQIYQFPTDDETVAEVNASMNVSTRRRHCNADQVKPERRLLLQNHLPFAVVGSTDEIKLGNKMVKARQYPWGTVQGKRKKNWVCFSLNFSRL